MRIAEFVETPGRDPYETALAAGLGRHILASCLFLVSCVWAWQAFHEGGTSPVMKDVVGTFGPWAGRSFVLIALVLLVACFRRPAKLVGGLLWGAECLTLAFQALASGRIDIALAMVAFSGLGLALALLAKAGPGR